MNKKRIAALVLSCFILGQGFTTSVNATEMKQVEANSLISIKSTEGNNKAFSVGANYKDGGIFGLGNVDTTGDAKTAADYYGSAGYDSYYTTAPTYQEMRGEFKDGTSRMSSEILFFSGHANNTCVAFNHNNEGGKYKTGVYYDENFESSKGYKYAGLKSYDISKTKLITFAGCNTATEDTNLPSVAVDEGVDAAIGWTKKVGSGSHTKWLEHFNDYLNKGYTVEAAKEHADSKFYWDGNVKKGKIFGEGSTKIRDGSNSKSLYEFSGEFSGIELPYEKETDIINELLNINPNFDISDYYVNEIKSDSDRIIEYYYKVGEARTLSGYVIKVANDTMTIYDNTKDIAKPIQRISNCIETKKTIKEIEQNALNNFKPGTKEGDTLKIISSEEIYNHEDGNVYGYVKVEHSLANTDLTAVYEYFEKK